MGKYSLDAFEVHPLIKLRPAMAAPQKSRYRLLELNQAELEPLNGELLTPPPVGGGTVIVQLNMEKNTDIADACGFVRRMGCCYEGGKLLAGVVVKEAGFSGAALNQLAQAYSQAFEAAFLLAEPGTEAAEACSRLGIGFGLWLPLERGILPLRRSIGQNNLSRNWEKYPVFLSAGRQMTEEEVDAARRWHADGADVPAVLGPRMTLRRMMFPRDLTAGGPLPMRMWWQNLGSAPLYRDAEICLELYDGKDRFPIRISGGTFRPGVGDSTFNDVARLPEAQGTFDLRCGLRGHGGMLRLAMDAPEEEGMYTVGKVTLDSTARPYLATMWEETYADGYYPLEDPAQPE